MRVRRSFTRKWTKYVHCTLPFTPALPLLLDPALAFSTSVFHFFTISFARSATSFDACERSLPTARPALLSYRRHLAKISAGINEK